MIKTILPLFYLTMKREAWLVPATGVLFMSFTFFPDEKEEVYIEWSKDRKLRWEDYRGKVQKRNAVASTCYELRYIFPVNTEGIRQPTVSVRSLFFPEESWKKEEYATDYVLAHEQGHFDLVEVFARRLRRAIASREYHSLTELHKHIHVMYDSINRKMDETQNRYDAETENSMNQNKQKAWEKKIQQELRLTEKFSHPVIFLRGKIQQKK